MDNKINTINTIKTIGELRSFIEQTLPNFSVTGRGRDLRKIKDDPTNGYKSLIIWFGCPTMSAVIELRVKMNLDVIPLHGDWEEARLAQDLLKTGWTKRLNRLEKNNERKLKKMQEEAARIKRNERKREQRKLKKMAVPAEVETVETVEETYADASQPSELPVTQPVEA
jgi:hypothetical protein